MRSTALLVLILLSVSGWVADADERADHFERFVRPIFENHCVECHNDDTAEMGVRFDEAPAFFGGGEAGPIVVPGDSRASRFVALLSGHADKQMPPDYLLEAAQIATLRKWVDAGAYWPGYEGALSAPPFTTAGEPLRFTDQQLEFWAFQPIADPEVPDVDSDWVISDVDRFIWYGLEQDQLQPAPATDRRTWMRRVTYDLTGLPPTMEEIDAFLGDLQPGAHGRLIDRLLESPHYGEQWGRHWLDVVRFAESAAHDGNNAYLHAWRYRDYVISAFNRDKPYDQFVIEQLAGDLLPETGDAQQDFDQVVATGFLQVGTKPVVMRDKRQMLLDIADEQIHTTGVVFLGMTLGCARCHDHKFDPIPTADYYSLAGIFLSTHIMADAELDSMWTEFEVPDPYGETVTVMAVEDQPEAKNERIHLRGNRRTLGAEVPRRFLQIIAGVDHDPIETEGSGRLELANWIASPEHPLTARVIVNRIWQYHFGRGLVGSSGDFGVRGETPSHPKLLDYLASRFIESGWSVKAMHRLILGSATYRQAHVKNAEAELADVENRLLWRFPRRRLDAEEIRDTILEASGDLDQQMGGTLFTVGYAPVSAERKLFTVDISKGDAGKRMFGVPVRSVYLPVIRNGRPEMLLTFDAPNSHEPANARSETTVAPQALFMLNSPFVREQAMRLTRNIMSDMTLAAGHHDAGSPASDPQARAVWPTDDELRTFVSDAFSSVLRRSSTEDELTAGVQFITNYQQTISADPALVADSADEFEEILIPLDEAAATIRKHPDLIEFFDPQLITFDRKTTRLEVGSPVTLNQAAESITIECWVNPAAAEQDGRPNLIVGRDFTERLWKIGFYEKVRDGALQNELFYELFGDTAAQVTPAPPGMVLPPHQPSHIVATIGAGERKLYVNGELVHSATTHAKPGQGSDSLSIGGRPNNQEWFKGSIRNVAIYKSVLDAETIASHYHVKPAISMTDEERRKLVPYRAYVQTLMCTNEFLYLE